MFTDESGETVTMRIDGGRVYQCDTCGRYMTVPKPGMLRSKRYTAQEIQDTVEALLYHVRGATDYSNACRKTKYNWCREVGWLVAHLVGNLGEKALRGILERNRNCWLEVLYSLYRMALWAHPDKYYTSIPWLAPIIFELEETRGICGRDKGSRAPP
jgi:hypothetical protein